MGIMGVLTVIFAIASIASIGVLGTTPSAFAASTPGETLYGVTGGDGDYDFYQLTDGPNFGFIDSGPVTVSGIEFDTDGTLYVAGAANGGNALFGTIDPSDGSYTDIITGDAECTDIGIDPTDGTLYCQDKGDLYSIDKITGVTSGLIGSTGLGVLPLEKQRGNAMDIAPDGTFYYGNQNGLYTLGDPGGASPGVATLIALWIFPVEIPDTGCRTNAFDFDNSGTLWASLNCGSSDFLVTIDETTAQITHVETNTFSDLDGISFDGGPDVPGVPVGGTLFPIDTTALLLAGIQTNALWIMSTLAIIGSVAFGAVYIIVKKN